MRPGGNPTGVHEGRGTFGRGLEIREVPPVFRRPACERSAMPCAPGWTLDGEAEFFPAPREYSAVANALLNLILDLRTSMHTPTQPTSGTRRRLPTIATGLGV